MGWEFCIRTVPMAQPEASISMTKGGEKSGKAKVGACVIASL
ncbi:hypothetical protein A2U01_0087137, partial [Trifolium medium]|nr:hypothetical protein [Trifolium medium]